MIITITFKEFEKHMPHMFRQCYIWIYCTSCGYRFLRKASPMRACFDDCKCGRGRFLADIVDAGETTILCA